MTISRQVRLVARPVGLPKLTDWSFTDEPFRPWPLVS